MSRFPPPEGYARIQSAAGSFEAYLQEFPLLPPGSQVHQYDGSLKNRQDVHAAVLDLDVGERDLQQCADAIMRLRAEYLRSQERYDDIHFNFTNGFRANYARWKAGERIRVQGNKVDWVNGGAPGNEEKSWKKYLTMVFSYAGTLSLSQEMQAKKLEELEIGDVFIRGGSPGHAVIVVDKVVQSESGAIAFLLAQSYMPAQEMHVLKNPLAKDHSPWYFVSQIEGPLITPEWRFSKEELKRF